MKIRLFVFVAATSGLLGCVGTTGGELIEFEAFGAGPEGRTAAETYSFTSGRGYEVDLTHAVLHVGGLYMNQSVPSSVAAANDCYLPGIYSLEVTEGRDIDVLSGDLQRFPGKGFATSAPSPTAEVWLNGGEIDVLDDPTVVARVEGTARRDGEAFPFTGTLTIEKNRLLPPVDAAHPGSHPICKQRIVTPIEVAIRPSAGGELVLRVDPRGWFTNVDFAELPRVSKSPLAYRIPNDASDIQSNNFFNGVRANAGVYHFSWEAAK